jgi:valyl-tRNA synthetase
MTANIPELSSQYNPSLTESKWQSAWETAHAFKADPSHSGEPYCVVIPPPNVTGSLHMGHAFESALIDVLVRYHRMIGRNTLWLPGTDHASIAVQTILDRQLKDEGKTRYDIGRNAFLERAWQWKKESGGTIVNQLRRLGVSVDWSRERFTMDQGLSKAVLEAFVCLYNEGLIYRGSYLVHWCPASQSAVSDLEVENKEVEGHLWHFRYPLVEGSGHIEVATTRPETMLGDTAVAVNPTDDRYKHLIGQRVRLPIIGREIPIIGDEFVDPTFGTGCVKVTPAHDTNDFEMGKRHNLPFINILNKDGTLNEAAGEFVGKDRFIARNEVVDRLQSEGLLVKVEEYKHTVPYSDRGKVPVEPLISTQWFVKTETLAQKTLSFLDKDHSPHFVPERWTKVYRDWLVNLKDWCISRQLWWGHQIPAWYIISATEGEIRDNTPFVVAYSETEAREKAIAQFGEGVQLQQDPDVLDTWFSSGLWPFSTLGWPESTTDLNTYYPTTTLVTGFDIIFFWVARMTLMASHFTGKIPFQDVYIHGLVRDENGKKMSKSANNGIDPLVLIQEYGTDALRYTMIREVAGAGQDITLKLDRALYDARLAGTAPNPQVKETLSESVEASRNFANKLWNASRFVLMNLDGQTPTQLGEPQLVDLELCDRWILTRYQRIVLQTRTLIESYSLGEAAKGLYEFIWGDFCDWYIELVKSRLKQDNTPSRRTAQQTLAYVLEGTLKLLHPFMPHITEEIWQTLAQTESERFLALQPYPTVIPTAPPRLTQSPAVTDMQFRKSPAGVTQALQTSVKALDTFPKNLMHFAKQNRNLLLLLGTIGAGIISIDVLLGIISTLNRVPLLGSFLEIVGLVFAGQFIYRKLLWKENREAFFQQVRSQLQRIDLSVEASDTLLLPSSESGISPSSQTFSPTQMADFLHTDIEAQFDLLIGTIRTIRNLRSESNIKPGSQIKVLLQTESLTEQQALIAGQNYIQDLAKVDSLTIKPQLSDEEQRQTMVGVIGTVQVLIPLAGLIDINALRAKLEKDLTKVEKEVQSAKGRLSNQKFVSQAPPEVVQGARDSLAESETQVQILRDRLNRL